MNSPFEIVAHRGVSTAAPENTLPAFQRAIELGADAVELDVRLTRDGRPVVFHNTYMHETTKLKGPIFNYTFDQLRMAAFIGYDEQENDYLRIATLQEVLETLGGKIGLEVEIKGPEPEAVPIIGAILRDFRPLWDMMEITSYEPLLLLDIQRECPGIPTDLLIPLSEAWMGLDVVAYNAVQRGRLARVRAIHLHPTQLSPAVTTMVREAGLEIHAWDVNDDQSLQLVQEHHIPKVCTDQLEQALNYRASLRKSS